MKRTAWKRGVVFGVFRAGGSTLLIYTEAGTVQSECSSRYHQKWMVTPDVWWGVQNINEGHSSSQPPILLECAARCLVRPVCVWVVRRLLECCCNQPARYHVENARACSPKQGARGARNTY